MMPVNKPLFREGALTFYGALLLLLLLPLLTTVQVHGLPSPRSKAPSSRRELLFESYEQRQELFYYVSNEFQLTMINKLNKVALTSIKDAGKLDFLSSFDETTANIAAGGAGSQDSKLFSSFRLLHHDRDAGYVLVGGREFLFNISLNQQLKEDRQKRIHWPTSPLGKLRGQNNDPSCGGGDGGGQSCENYVRVAIPLSLDDDGQQHLIVCGTNSGQAFCRRFKLENNGTYELKNEFQKPSLIQMTKLTSQNLVNSHQVPAFKHQDSIYFFNYGSFTQEPNIFKQQLSSSTVANDNNDSPFQFTQLVKTPRGSLKNPNFRSSFAHSDKVYFFYSETESYDENNGVSFKTPYSLVGEVCADDMGRSSFSDEANRFVTFKKALIYCYLPDYKDGFHIKYSEIQAVSAPIKLKNDEEVIYAIFTYRRANTIDSALCQYQMPSIESTMKGYYKSMELAGDSVTYKKPLESCQAYKQLKESTLNDYYKEMNKYYKFQIEQSISERAMFALSNVKFSSLAVDEPNVNNNFNTVLFIGTADGRVIKLLTRPVNYDSKTYVQPIIVQEYQMFDKSQAVLSLIVQNSSDTWSLVAMTSEQIKSIRLDSSCQMYETCGQCVDSQDPYCVWSLDKQKCVSTRIIAQSATNEFLQDALNGNTNKCSTGGANYVPVKSNQQPDQQSIAAELSKLSGHTEDDDQDQDQDIDSDDDSIDGDSTARSRNEVLDLDDSASSSPSLKYYSSKHKYSMLKNAGGRTGNSPPDQSYLNSAHFVLIVCLTSVATCLLSILLTWLFIKKRYKMANYVSKHLLHSSSSSTNGGGAGNQSTSNRSSSSSASSTTSSSTYPNKAKPSITDANHIDPDDFMIKKFFSKIKLNRANHKAASAGGGHQHEEDYDDEKHVNVYEVPQTTSNAVAVNSKRQPHSPTTSSSNATSSSLNGSHSPPISTSNATATTQMHNDTLSSSSAGAMEDTEGFYTSNMDLSGVAHSHVAAEVAATKAASRHQPLSFLKRNYKNLSSSWFSKSSSSTKSGSSSAMGRSKDETAAVTQNLLTTVKPSELI